MITTWELKFYPSEKYPKRYTMMISGTIEDVKEICDFLRIELELEISPVFQIAGSNYNWGVYLYNLTNESKSKVIEKMFSICKEGLVDEEVDDDIEGRKNKLEGISDFKSKSLISEKTSTSQSLSSGLPLNPKYTFESFIVGNNNRFTHAAALAVAENPGKAYNPLFIYGGVGLGKTHLMQAIGHYIIQKYQKKVIYTTADRFVSQVIEAIRIGELQKFREIYSSIDVLLIDDIQFIAESESTQEEFFYIFDTLHQLGKQIVITSDRPPKMLTTLTDRLRSRFEWGLIADIKSPSLETRVAILKRKGEEENINIDDNILLYIASKLKSNIRELEGFLKRISAYATLINQPITMSLVKRLIAELLPEEELSEEEKKILKEEKLQKEVSYATADSSQNMVSTTISTKPQPKIQIYPGLTQPKVSSQPVSPSFEIFGEAKEKVSVEMESKPSQTQETPVVEKTSDDDKFYKDYTGAVNTVVAAFFYPEGNSEKITLIKQKFADVIKKHNLKYKIITSFEKSYQIENINYHMFIDECKEKKVNVCIVLSPPIESNVSSEEFYNNILPLMESAEIIFEYIPWSELNKEYRYLNLALDIALNKFKLI
jgi:chromosomal replication initiator protein